jgi:hypothetical protein
MKKAAEDVVIATAERLVRKCGRMRVALRQITDWANAASSLYDPIADRYSLQLPGELVRRIRELVDDGSHTESKGSA